MKNEPTSVPQILLDKVHHWRWWCQCGVRDIPVKVTRKGGVYGRCWRCGAAVHWNDIRKFLSPEPFCRHDLESKPTQKEGWVTTWCPQCRIRTFRNPASISRLEVPAGSIPYR